MDPEGLWNKLIAIALFCGLSLLLTLQSCCDKRVDITGKTFINSSLEGIRFSDRTTTLFKWHHFEYDYTISSDQLIISTRSYPCEETGGCSYYYNLTMEGGNLLIAADTLYPQMPMPSNELILSPLSDWTSTEFDSVTITLRRETRHNDELLGAIRLSRSGAFDPLSINHKWKRTGSIQEDFPEIEFASLIKEIQWIDTNQFSLNDRVSSHPVLIEICKFSGASQVCFKGFQLPYIYTELDKLVSMIKV